MTDLSVTTNNAFLDDYFLGALPPLLGSMKQICWNFWPMFYFFQIIVFGYWTITKWDAPFMDLLVSNETLFTQSICLNVCLRFKIISFRTTVWLYHWVPSFRHDRLFFYFLCDFLYCQRGKRLLQETNKRWIIKLRIVLTHSILFLMAPLPSFS